MELINAKKENFNYQQEVGSQFIANELIKSIYILALEIDNKAIKIYAF